MWKMKRFQLAATRELQRAANLARFLAIVATLLAFSNIMPGLVSAANKGAANKGAGNNSKPPLTPAKQAILVFNKLDKNHNRALNFQEFSAGLADKAKARQVFDAMQSELDKKSKAYQEASIIEFQPKYPKYAALKGAIQPEQPQEAKKPGDKKKTKQKK